MPKRSTDAEKLKVLDVIRALAERLGRVPLRADFKASGGSLDRVRRLFGGWRAAVSAAGLHPSDDGLRIGREDLLRDWGQVVRSLGAPPTMFQYESGGGKYSAAVYKRRFGWSQIPDAFLEFAKNDPSWADVAARMPQAGAHGAQQGAAPEVDDSKISPEPDHKRLDGRPTYGNPIDFRGLLHAPVNEQGVVFLFGMVAKELGYQVEAIQTGFPDCEAKRTIGGGKWQRVRIEFEFESRNFRDHGHDPRRCDVVVCWNHNWPDCPKDIEVVELATKLGKLHTAHD